MSFKVNQGTTWGHWPRLASQWPIANRHMFSGVSWGAESEFVVYCSKHVPKTTSSPSPWSIIVVQPIWILTVTAMIVMPFYLVLLCMLNIATGYSNNALSCSEWDREHAGESFRSLRHIVTPLLACKYKKCHFSRKFNLWPDLTRSNVDLGLKNMCNRENSSRRIDCFFREALRQSGADHYVGSYQPLLWRRWQLAKHGKRERAKHTGCAIKIYPSKKLFY